MVAINFKKEFVNIIQSGQKNQTIREKPRCKVGDRLQLYTGQRTKSCKKISDAICTSIEPIEIHECMIKLNGEVLQFNDMRDFVTADGFTSKRTSALNISHFFEFFESHYSLPFNGYLIKWEKLS